MNNVLDEKMNGFNSSDNNCTDRYKIKLSDEFKLKCADKLISKLRMDLGASESYIQELECENFKLKEKLNKLEIQHKKILDRYSQDAKNIIDTAPICKKLNDKISELQEANDKLKLIRDELICKLNKKNND